MLVPRLQTHKMMGLLWGFYDCHMNNDEHANDDTGWTLKTRCINNASSHTLRWLTEYLSTEQNTMTTTNRNLQHSIQNEIKT